MTRAPSAYTVWVRCYRRHVDESYEPVQTPQLLKLCKLLKQACDNDTELMELVCAVALDDDYVREHGVSPAYVTRYINKFRSAVERERKQWEPYIAPTGLDG